MGSKSFFLFFFRGSLGVDVLSMVKLYVDRFRGGSSLSDITIVALGEHSNQNHHSIDSLQTIV